VVRYYLLTQKELIRQRKMDAFEIHVPHLSFCRQ